MYLINHPLNFQAVNYVIQKLREKHPGDYYDSKYIKQNVYNIHSYEDIYKALNNVYKNNSRAFKINVSFVIIFEKLVFTPSKNESHLLTSDIANIVSHKPSNKFYL